MGCTYDGALRESFYKSNLANNSNKLQYKVAIVNTSDLQNAMIQESEGGYKINIKTAPDFANAMKSELSNVFVKAQLIDTPLQGKDFDMIVFPKFAYQMTDSNRFLGNFKYQASLDYIFKDPKTDSTIYQYKANHTINYEPPGSVRFLGVITGFTLFVASPITIPASKEILGDHATGLFESAITKLIAEQSDQVFLNKKTIDDYFRLGLNGVRKQQL